jgi:hypothetical protein
VWCLDTALNEVFEKAECQAERRASCEQSQFGTSCHCGARVAAKLVGVAILVESGRNTAVATLLVVARWEEPAVDSRRAVVGSTWAVASKAVTSSVGSRPADGTAVAAGAPFAAGVRGATSCSAARSPLGSRLPMVR